MGRRFALGCLIGGLLCATGANTQTLEPRVPDPTGFIPTVRGPGLRHSFSITGSVVDAVTGEPIVGASVDLCFGDSCTPRMLTDSLGTFTIVERSWLSYLPEAYVLASAPGYADGTALAETHSDVVIELSPISSSGDVVDGDSGGQGPSAPVCQGRQREPMDVASLSAGALMLFVSGLLVVKTRGHRWPTSDRLTQS